MILLISPLVTGSKPFHLRRMAVIFLFSGLAVLFYSLLVWFPPAAVSSNEGYPKNGVITGQVKLPDGTPDRTTVRLWQTTRGSYDSMIKTSFQGGFVARDLGYGHYWLLVRDQLVGTVELTAKQPAVSVNLTAPPYVTLKGIVREKTTGKPIPNALVMHNLLAPPTTVFKMKYPVMGNAYEWAQERVLDLMKRARQTDAPFTVADAAGQYELQLPPRANLFAISPDQKFFPAEWSLQAAPGAVVTHNFDLNPTADHRIKGRITLPDGKPYASGPAKFYVRRHEDIIHDIITDAQGYYEFLPKDSVYNTQWLEVEGFAPMHQHAPLSKGTPFSAIDWQLKPPQQGELIASVLQADGKTPFPDGFKVHYMREYLAGHEEPKFVGGKPKIFYYNECGGASSAALVTLNGLLRNKIDPGFYRLYATPAPLGGPMKLATSETSWWGLGDHNREEISDSHDPTFLTHITIEPTQTTTVKFVQPAHSALTITVKDEKGAVLPGIRLRALRWMESKQHYRGISRNLITNEDGQVYYDPVPAGEYVFYPLFHEKNKEVLTHRHAVKLEPGKNHQLEMVLSVPKGASVPENELWNGEGSGQVFLPDGKTPASYAAIYFSRTKEGDVQERNPSTFADAEGHFTFENQKPGPAIIAARGDGTALTSVPMQVKKKTPPVRLVLEPAATITGKVIARPGTDLDGITVAVLPQPKNRIEQLPDPLWSFKAWVMGTAGLPLAPDGTFTLHGVNPGKQFVCLYRDGLLLQESLVPVEIEPGEHLKNVAIVVDKGTKLEIHFKLPGKKPLPSYVTAHLYSDYGSIFSCGGMTMDGNIAKSKRELPAGKYHLWLETSYYVNRSPDNPPGLIYRNITIKPGQEKANVDITIPESGSIKGKVNLKKRNYPLSGLIARVHVPDAVPTSYVAPPLELIRDVDQPVSYANTYTAPDGSFTLFGLMPGSYRISFHQKSESPALFVSGPVTVQEGKTTEVGAISISP